jgi:hypothetical protein
MFISGSGRVGIGTSNPTATLSVSGSFNVVTPGGASAITLLGNNNHGRIFQILNTDSTNTTFGFSVATYSDGGSNRYIELFGENTTGNYLQGSWSVGGYMYSPSGFTGGYHTSLNLVQWYSNNVNTGVLISNQNNSYQTMFWRDGNVTIADSSITSGSQSPSRFFVKGLGTTASTTALAVQNASGTNTFSVKDGIAATSANTGKLQVIAGNWTDSAFYTDTIWRTGSFASAKDIIIGSDGVLNSYSSRLNFVNYYGNGGQGNQSNFAGYLRTSIGQYTATGGPGGNQNSGRGTLLLGVYDTDYSSNVLNSFDVVSVGKYATTISGSLTVSGSVIVSGSDITTAWTSYTPAWTTDGGTQPVLNNGTVTGAYKVIGKTCFVRVKLNPGSSTTFGSGAFQFSLPFTASSADGVQFPCSILNDGLAWYQATVNGTYSGATNKSAIIAQSGGGANSSEAVTATHPFTFGASDSIQFNGSYEIA